MNIKLEYVKDEGLQVWKDDENLLLGTIKDSDQKTEEQLREEINDFVIEFDSSLSWKWVLV